MQPIPAKQGGAGATSISAALDAAFGSTQGMVLYRGASAWAALGPGASGQVLQTAGTGANPSWANMAVTTTGVTTSGSPAAGQFAQFSSATAITTATASPNTVLAGPASGTASGNVAPRALVPADIPSAYLSTATPAMNGTAAAGSTGKASDAGHVHPTDTTAAPPGKVSYFAMNAAPTGYLKANGAAVSRTAYAALYAAIGTTFGTGDGSTTFNVPDLRGQFLRSWADNGATDSGRVFGSAQAQNMPAHQHATAFGVFGGSYVSAQTDGNGLGVYGDQVVSGNYSSLTPSLASGSFHQSLTGPVLNPSGELRPANVALLACIKY